MTVDLTTEPLGQNPQGAEVFLKDVWPTSAEVQKAMGSAVHRDQFVSKYASVFDGDERWRELPAPGGRQFPWDGDSTYVQHPPFFEDLEAEPVPPGDIVEARVLAVLGDSVTTDHISPAGAIPVDGPAGQYLVGRGVDPKRLQLVWESTRESRSHDARNLCKHPLTQQAGARDRRRLDAASARW